LNAPAEEPREEPASAPDADAVADPAQADLIPNRPSDWGSLLADLSRGRDHPVFRVHDRTHVEFAVSYRLRPGHKTQSFVWEAYFFAPESLRLHSRTYAKSDLYSDLQSYVRFEVPHVEYARLTEEPLERLSEAIRSGDEKAAMREMRLFACMVRAAGVEARDAIAQALSGDPASRRRAVALAAQMIHDTARIGPKLRTVLALAADAPDPLCTAARWVDEDVSRLCETLLGNVVHNLRAAFDEDEPSGGSASRLTPAEVIAAGERAAVAEARYRLERGLGGVGRIGMKTRKVEELEFRRHVLKRFTSSVLWLDPQIRPASTWILHLLYAVAASVAMGFAVVAALWSGNDWSSRGFVPWVVAVILAYAAKDRIKALLQTIFADVVMPHFPDRRWRIRDRERGIELGTMKEQSGFVPFSKVPEDVLKVRRMTRLHPLEEQARPEAVIFHRKECVLDVGAIAQADPRFTALTEIFRLDLRRWLAHTDDPKRGIIFADPVANTIGTAVAPRVYNISVIYRLRRNDEPNAPWHRVRIVVTRKGIRRIDPVV
jgi:hypothetical protein